ncbi:hypothetical protein [Streptomyces sp. NPDC004286]|uniref:hypothetical protein n=1 Tax=Streptomyces sp. NPDC004286 TaxID=3364696 RepID=UPI00368657CF
MLNMDWTPPLKKLAAAVEGHNRAAARLSSAETLVSELLAQAQASGAPAQKVIGIIRGLTPPENDQPQPASVSNDADADPVGLVRYTLEQACREGILPLSPSAARTNMRTRSRERGVTVPEGRFDGRATRYTELELRTWYTAWEESRSRK